MNKTRTLRSVAGRATLAAAMLALAAGMLSVAYDCGGAARASAHCPGSGSLFLLTSGIWFLAAWPPCVAAGVLRAWWKNLRMTTGEASGIMPANKNNTGRAR